MQCMQCSVVVPLRGMELQGKEAQKINSKENLFRKNMQSIGVC